MALSSWLFIREQESIWIERPSGFFVIVAGPGSARAHLVFPNEDALRAHQLATAERLTWAGWFLWGFDKERRKRAPASGDTAHHSRSTSTGRRGVKIVTALSSETK